MWIQFILENLRFAISLFAGLIFFGVCWLYFDAWLEKHEKKELLRYLGFFLLAFSFAFSATQVESTLIEVPFSAILGNILASFSVLAKIVGLVLIANSLVIDPIQPRPDVSEFANAGFFGMPSLLPFSLLHPLLALFIGFLYFKRATIGLERHLRPVAIAFFVLGFSEFLSLGSFFRSTTNVGLYNLVAVFGPIWFARYISLAVATFILGKWVFGYLLKRFLTQLFMIFTSSILVIFLVTAVTFSGILLGNIQKETFARLEIDARVLAYAIDTKKAQTLSDAQLAAQNSQIVSTLSSRKSLATNLENLLLSKDQSFLWALDSNGTVLARGEDSEKFGDSMAGDPLVQRALEGVAATSIVTADGKTRPVGIKEENVQVKSQVLEKGESLNLALKILGVPYLGAYLPLKDISEKPVGVIFVGEPQTEVLQTAGASIELTFISTVALLLLSVIPSYLIAKYIAKQVE